jgi:2-keto-4-pentenoate hydratase/2-oxohepta-3-ene-1,7-dioic acid hydratase in catechol pathway
MLVSYHTGDPDDARTGIRDAKGNIRQAPSLLGAASVLDILADWESIGPKPADTPVIENARLTVPLRYPSKVLCAGANYHGHLKEMGVDPPDGNGRPYFFFKPPTSTVIGPYDQIVLPQCTGRRIDWEAELAVVIGRRARHLEYEQAHEHIAGYTILNDISARDQLVREDALAPPFGYDWISAKGQDTFCPLGPGITPAWFVEDPQDLTVRLTVNDRVKQDSTTADMIYSVRDLIVEASRLMTLEPGDVIATGTPAGIGAPRNDFLAPGDVVVVEIEGLGTLCNTVADSPTLNHRSQ